MYKNARPKGWKPPELRWSTGRFGKPGLPLCIVCRQQLWQDKKRPNKYRCPKCGLKYPLKAADLRKVAALKKGEMKPEANSNRAAPESNKPKAG